jgi:hypothetical protein
VTTPEFLRARLTAADIWWLVAISIAVLGFLLWALVWGILALGGYDPDRHDFVWFIGEMLGAWVGLGIVGGILAFPMALVGTLWGKAKLFGVAAMGLCVALVVVSAWLGASLGYLTSN